MPKRDLKKELSQFLNLQGEVRMLDDELSRLHVKQCDISSNAKSDSVKGSMICEPYIIHNITVIGLSDEELGVKNAIKKDITAVKNQLSNRRAACVKEYRRLHNFIARVPNSEMRQILTFKYVYDLNWPEIAARLGSGVTKDSVRVAHDRFLEKF